MKEIPRNHLENVTTDIFSTIWIKPHPFKYVHLSTARYAVSAKSSFSSFCFKGLCINGRSVWVYERKMGRSHHASHGLSTYSPLRIKISHGLLLPGVLSEFGQFLFFFSLAYTTSMERMVVLFLCSLGVDGILYLWQLGGSSPL